MEVNFATLALEILMEDPRCHKNMAEGPRKGVVIDALTKAGNRIAERLEKAEKEVQTLKARDKEWVAANAPGGWIDGLRKQVESLKAANKALEQRLDFDDERRKVIAENSDLRLLVQGHRAEMVQVRENLEAVAKALGLDIYPEPDSHSLGYLSTAIRERVESEGKA